MKTTKTIALLALFFLASAASCDKEKEAPAPSCYFDGHKLEKSANGQDCYYVDGITTVTFTRNTGGCDCLYKK